MFSKTADFCKKGDIKAFASGKSGKTALADKFRTKVMATAIFLSGIAAPALNSAFAQQRQKIQIRPRVENATCKTASGETLTYRIYNPFNDSIHAACIKKTVDAAVATPTGEAVLKPFMQKKGMIAMREGMGNTVGMYHINSNSIYLNADFINYVENGMAYLKSSLVHEAAHAKQNYAGVALDRSMNAATMFRVGRASEADANTHQLFAAKEMAANGDSLVWKVMEAEKPTMVKAMQEAQRNGATKAQTAKAVMLAYYEDDGYISIYDKTYLDLAQGAGRVDASTAKKRSQTNLTPAQIAAKACVMGKTPYLGNDAGVLLSDSLRSAVSEEIYEQLAQASLQHEEALKKCGVTGVKADVSYKTLYVRRKDGTYRAPEKAVQTAANAAVRNRAASR